MARSILVAANLIASMSMAMAHGSPQTHSHPHGDWSLVAVSLFALGALAGLFIISMHAIRSRKVVKR